MESRHDLAEKEEQWIQAKIADPHLKDIIYSDED